MTTTTNTTAPKKIEEQRFEFIFTINNKFIVQRYFNIRDFNEDSVNSLELKELMDVLVGMNNGTWGQQGIIPAFLKKKAVDYLWDNYDPYYIKPEEGAKNIFERIDNYQFEIKIDKNTVAKSEFSANYFPPKVRYDVNIREIIPSIMGEIREFLSQKKYNKVEPIGSL